MQKPEKIKNKELKSDLKTGRALVGRQFVSDFFRASLMTQRAV